MKRISLIFISALVMISSIPSVSIGVDRIERFNEKDFEILLNSLNQDYLGRGVDVFNDDVKDRPMAYGLILSALVKSYSSSRDDRIAVKIKKCGDWLLANTDINENKIQGYGLADAWDAFGDKSINPIHQEYTITTAIIINGLLDWMEYDNSSPKEKIKSTVISLIEPYLLQKYNSPSGLYSYSLNNNDLKYNVYNPAVYLAGQMQRLSQAVVSKHLKEILSKEADRIMGILINNRLIDQNNNWYWNYGYGRSSIERPNDLVHALYIIDSIDRYVEYNGYLTKDIDLTSLKNHLYMFYKNKKWVELFHLESFQERPVRLWALGFLLYYMSKNEFSAEMKSDLTKKIKQYQMPDGRFRYNLDSDKHLIRHDAHLLYGISYSIFNNKPDLN